MLFGSVANPEDILIDVSLIIPTYNRQHLVYQAIESCLKEAECGIQVQIIVIDDCSTDGTRNILSEYRDQIDRIFLSQNAGQCKARNVGLSKALGRYVKFLDSDDVLGKGTLVEEISLADRESADIVVSAWGTVSIDDIGRPIAGSEIRWPVPDMHPLPESILFGRAVPTSAALYRMTYIQGLEWDSRVRKLDDWDWFCQAAMRRGKIVSLDKISYWMRDHQSARVTTSSSMLINAQDHHIILHKIEDALRQRVELTKDRAERLAQYFYKELRVLSLYDRQAFEKAAEHIHSLDPHFHPVDEERDSYMRLLARVIGFRRTVLLHTYIKRRIKRIPLPPKDRKGEGAFR
jgi:glycosyltransferase involved in cell wall biosynthesis